MLFGDGPSRSGWGKLCANAIDNAAGRTVPIAATRIYELSFFTGFGVSSVVYYVLNRLFPVVGAAAAFEEIDVSGYESMPKKLSVFEET